jgi:predicted DNA-binding transcriptional regulator AlpA
MPPVLPEKVSQYEQLPRLLTVADLRRLYRIPKSTVHYWRKRGEFPEPVAVGRRKRCYLTVNIEAWLQARKAA